MSRFIIHFREILENILSRLLKFFQYKQQILDSQKHKVSIMKIELVMKINNDTKVFGGNNKSRSIHIDKITRTQ